MRVTTLAGMPLALAAAAAALGYLGSAGSIAVAGTDPTQLGGTLITSVSSTVTLGPGGAPTPPVAVALASAPPRRWCALSPLTGTPSQSAPRYERADPRRPTREPTDSCQPAAAA
jgi:hypothetical protein